MSDPFEHFEEIVRRVAAGETLTAVLGSRPEYPKRKTLEKHLRRHPELRARLDAVKPAAGQALVRKRWADILAAIRAGSTAVAAVEAVGGTGVSFFKVVASDPNAKAEFVGATAERESGEHRVGKTATGRWTDADFDRAVDALRDNPKLAAARVLDEHLPSLTLILDRARSNAEYRERLAEAVADRKRRRAGSKKAPQRQYEIGVLRRGLMALDEYRAAAAVVAGFDPFDRDDAISEIVLALLEGELDIDDVQADGKRFAYDRAIRQPIMFRSLDETHFNTHNADTLGDMISNGTPIHFY